MVTIISKEITVQMVKNEKGRIIDYRVLENNNEIFRFNNPKVTIIFLLKSLFPNEPEHTFKPSIPNPEIDKLREKYGVNKNDVC